jgi:hypothetical protein
MTTRAPKRFSDIPESTAETHQLDTNISWLLETDEKNFIDLHADLDDYVQHQCPDVAACYCTAVP